MLLRVLMKIGRSWITGVLGGMITDPEATLSQGTLGSSKSFRNPQQSESWELRQLG